MIQNHAQKKSTDFFFYIYVMDSILKSDFFTDL